MRSASAGSYYLREWYWDKFAGGIAAIWVNDKNFDLHIRVFQASGGTNKGQWVVSASERHASGIYHSVQSVPEGGYANYVDAINAAD